MPQPTRSDVHVNKPLTNLSVAYVQEMSNFGADRMFTRVPVRHQSDSYYIYDKGNWFRSDAQVRAPGTEAAGSGYTLSTDTYSCKVRAIRKDVDDQIRANQDDALDLDREAVEFVTHDLLLKRETDFLDTYFVTGLWTGGTGGTDVVPGTKWDATGGTPLDDMRAQIWEIQAKTGKKGNVIGMSRAVWNVLVDNPQIVGRLSNDSEKFVLRAFVARLLEVDEIVVFDAVENSAVEGAADSMGRIASADRVLILHRPTRPGLMTAAAGYTFTWSGFSGAGPAGNRIKRYRMEHLSADRIEGEMAYDQKLVDAQLGAVLDDVLT